MVLLKVQQAELRMCQEQLVQIEQSQPRAPSDRWWEGPQETAAEAAAFAVAAWVNRAQARLRAAEFVAAKEGMWEKNRKARAAKEAHEAEAAKSAQWQETDQRASDAVDGGKGGSRPEAEQQTQMQPEFLILPIGEQKELDEEASHVAAQVPNTVVRVGAPSPSPDTGSTPIPEEDISAASLALALVPVSDNTLALDSDALQRESVKQPASKELLQAQKELRDLNLVVAKSKSEALFYAEVLQKAQQEHAAEVVQLKEALDREKAHCQKEMEHWKRHVKREQVNDPVIFCALKKWGEEVLRITISLAFTEWRRRASYITKMRGTTGKLTLISTLLSIISRWKECVVITKADRLRSKLGKSVHSLDQALLTWTNEAVIGLMKNVFSSWNWVRRHANFSSRCQGSIAASLQRFLDGSEDMLVHHAFNAWTLCRVEEKMKQINARSTKIQSVSKALLTFAGETGLSVELRLVFHAWRRAIAQSKVEAFQSDLSRQDMLLQRSMLAFAEEKTSVVLFVVLSSWSEAVKACKAKEHLKNARLSGATTHALKIFGMEKKAILQTCTRCWYELSLTKRLTRQGFVRVAYSIGKSLTASDTVTHQLVFKEWHTLVVKGHLKERWTKYFKTDTDMQPVFAAWATFWRRAQSTYRAMRVANRMLQLTTKEHIPYFLASVVTAWRRSLPPPAAVAQYFPKLERAQRVIMKKWTESQEHAVLIDIVQHWAREVMHQAIEEVTGMTREDALKNRQEHVAERRKAKIEVEASGGGAADIQQYLQGNRSVTAEMQKALEAKAALEDKLHKQESEIAKVEMLRKQQEETEKEKAALEDKVLKQESEIVKVERLRKQQAETEKEKVALEGKLREKQSEAEKEKKDRDDRIKQLEIEVKQVPASACCIVQ